MANITKTEVDATAEEIVSSEVLDVLTSSMVAPGAIMDMSGQVSPGMDKLKLPEIGNWTVVDKAAGTPLVPAAQTFSTVDLDLDKHQAVPFLLEDIASLQSKVAVSQVLVNQAGRDLAAKVDSEIITDMALSANISAAAPDHIQVFDTPSLLVKADVLKARELLDTANVQKDGRSAIVSPDQESALMAISEFTRVDESGGSNALRNGMIGKLFGFDILVSSQAPSADGPLFFHRSTSAFARQQAINVKTEFSALDLGTKWVISHIYGFVNGRDSGKRIVKFNASGA